MQDPNNDNLLIALDGTRAAAGSTYPAASGTDKWCVGRYIARPKLVAEVGLFDENIWPAYSEVHLGSPRLVA